MGCLVIWGTGVVIAVFVDVIAMVCSRSWRSGDSFVNITAVNVRVWIETWTPELWVVAVVVGAGCLVPFGAVVYVWW